MIATNLFALVTSLALTIPATAYPQLQVRDLNPHTSFSVVGYSDYDCEGTSKYSWNGDGEVTCQATNEKNIKSFEVTTGSEYRGAVNIAIHENDSCDGVIRRVRLTGSGQTRCLRARRNEDENQSILSWDADRVVTFQPVVGF